MFSNIRRLLLKHYLAKRPPKQHHGSDEGRLLHAFNYLSAMESERYRDPLRLLQFGYKVFSQHDEDGILQEIFHRIGAASRRFVELGAGNGSENNTVNLLLSGWSGIWIEAGVKNLSAIPRDLAEHINKGNLKVVESFVTRENINALLADAGATGEIDLLSIDLDGNDYWVWENVTGIAPRVVVIEYNATLRPPHRLVMRYHPAHVWDGSNYFGASLKALEVLGERKGYSLVGCSLAGTNAFFVRHDLAAGRFLAPFSAENHYEPARYFTFPAGHPARIGPYDTV